MERCLTMREYIVVNNTKNETVVITCSLLQAVECARKIVADQIKSILMSSDKSMLSDLKKDFTFVKTVLTREISKISDGEIVSPCEYIRVIVHTVE